MAERIDVVISERGAKTVSRNIADIGKTSRESSKGVESLKKLLGTLASAVVLRQATNTLASFSLAMSTVKAVTQATDDEFKKLRDSAKDLGATTIFTATQVAEGMLFLARAGFNTEQVLLSIASTLDLAQSGAIDLGLAADIASNILKGFNLEVVDIVRVIDALVRVTNSANTDIPQLGEAMKFVAPIAAGLKVSLEETAAAIGVLSDAGLQSTLAGTGLKTILAELENQSFRTVNILRALGVVSDEVRPTQVGLTNAILELKDAGVDASLALEIFGQRGAPAFIILADGVSRLIELTEELQNADGAAREMAATMNDNLRGAMSRASSAFESLQIQMGDQGASSFLRNSFERVSALLLLTATHADTLTTVLGVLAAVITIKLVQGALALLLSTLTKVGIAITVLTIKTIPLFAGAGLIAFAALAVAAETTGKTIREVFFELKFEIESLLNNIINPTQVITDFQDRITGLQNLVTALGGAGALAEEDIKSISDEVKSLQAIINKRLLLQQFLTPGSDAVEKMKMQLASLNMLFDNVKSNLETPLRFTVNTSAGQSIDPNFEKFVRNLAQENELLTLNTNSRLLRANIFKVENEVGRKLTETEIERIKTLTEFNITLTAQREVLDSILGPTEIYNTTLDALNDLLNTGTLTTQQYTRAVDELRIAFLETKTNALAGFERGLLKTKLKIEDVATIVETTLVNAFQSAEDAFIKFVKTGKLSFKDFADSIIEQIARIAFQKSILDPISDIFSGFFGDFLGNFLGASGTGAGASSATGVSAGFIPRFHNGLSASESMSRPASTLKFLSAPVLHNGLAPDEFPAILQRGEAVIPRGENKNMLGVTVNVYDQRTNENSSPVTVNEQTSADGRRMISVLITDTIKRQIINGNLDQSLRGRFNLTPVLQR